ncbi:PH domain-containing protein [Shewanella sp. OMA3-2]|uniref:PH domain-containing protein n=1 Tax=Shewanella sp. OMA3-2 TaxID=2908650 RepID=UPI001F44555F|nr:PH domain-containing protein [Shewanella sp. OMA3-2]UJF23008.1 PH domain-containing protein [Shewanella sp. OMA3-2]
MPDAQPPNADEQANTNTQSSLSDWKALSPWSILSFVFGSLKSILSNSYALIPVFYAGWSNDVSIIWVIEGLIALLILLTSFAFIQWRKFRYRINTEQLDVKRGLFFTKKDEIPLTRIQNIRFEQPFYFKPLKLAVLVIETAGSSKDEAKLSALDAEHAQILKQHLLQLNHVSDTVENIGSADDNMAVESTPLSQPIVKRSLKELILFGFYQNNFIWFAIIAGPVAGQIEWEKVAQSPLINTLIEWVNQATHDNFMLQLIMVVGLFILGYVLFSMISILASVLKYHPYALDKHQQTLLRSGGVIAHQQDALAIKRIQVVHFQQPLLARFVNRWTLFLKQVKGNEVEEKTKQHMLIPSVKTAEIEPIFSKLPLLSTSAIKLPTDYIGINITWLYKRIWLPFIPFSILLGLFFILDIDIKLVEVAFIAAISVSVLLYIRYKRWGYVLEEDAVWQHSGLLGRDWKRIPFEKIQHVKIIQTARQKTQQLAYLELGLASGTITLPYIPIQVANTLVARSLNTVCTQYQQWI